MNIFFCGVQVEAEDLKFIDSNGELGYYVDMDSVSEESLSVLSVNFIVIRADRNEMEVTRLKIDHENKTYTVQSTKTLSYDVRSEITSDSARRPPKAYSDKSLMEEIVNFILNGGE